MTERTVRAVLEAARDNPRYVVFPPNPRWFRVTAVADCTPTTCRRKQCEAVVDLCDTRSERPLAGIHVAAGDTVTVVAA